VPRSVRIGPDPIRHIRNVAGEFGAKRGVTKSDASVYRVRRRANASTIRSKRRGWPGINVRNAICDREGMRRAFPEALMSAGSVLILLLVLIGFNDGVRDQVSRRVSHPSVELASVGRQARHVTNVIAQSARDHSLGHAPLLIFTLAAAVLVFFMLRT
jgi:hypothetical protein